MATTTVCAIDGCGRWAVYTVAKTGEERLVCRKCALEMIELLGWRLL